jgi:hypothetical protein
MLTPNKYVVVAVIVSLAVAFGFGRWSAPQKIVTETKVVIQKDATKETQSDQDKHSETNTVQVKKPDGTIITKTTTKTDTDTKRKTEQETKTDQKSDTRTEITKSSSPVTINALAGVNVTSLTGGLIYGLSISRPILGPITIGAWGMTNKTGGFSLGIQF